MSRLPADFDGLIGEGWSGVDPDGAHVNVVLAERGSATAASLLGTFTSPAPGHAPILVVVGETKHDYEPVWPPTIMINKAAALEEQHQTITWGAGQLGIGQAVLDAVAEELIPSSGNVLVFVAIYIDPGATDETKVRISSRAATLKGIRTAVTGRDADAARSLVQRRDTVRNPFYGGE
jgi:formaldehyde-activating enzyme